MKRKVTWLVPLFALLFVFGVVVRGALANEFAQIADQATVKLLDANGSEITANTNLKYGDIVTVVADGLKPDTNYSVQIGWTATTTGTDLAINNDDADNDGDTFDPGELANPSLPGTANHDVMTDANGHFSIQYKVGEIACDSSEANRTLTVHEGTGTSPGSPVLIANAFGIQPVIKLTLDNEAAYGNAAGVTWSQLGFNATQGKVNDTTWNPVAAASDCPYTLTVHGFTGEAGYRAISFKMGATSVPLWVSNTNELVTTMYLNAKGAFDVPPKLAIPEIPAKSFPIVGTDAEGNTASYDFTVVPALLYAGTDDPANDVEILAQISGSELLAD